MSNCRASRLFTSALAAATALGALTLTACDAESGGSVAGDDQLSVVASFYPMEFLVERIGGDHVFVETLTPPGIEPHDFELSPQQTGRLSEADLIVYLAGLQPAVDGAIEQAGVENVVEATSLTSLEAHAGSEDHDGHDHDHDVLDPHIWLDPVRFTEVAEGVGEALAKADPGHAADYERGTENLTEELRALDEEFSTGLEHPESTTFITTHSAFGYLAERYDLNEESISGLDPESEPSGARMKELHEVAAQEKVNTVFFETLASDDTARTLAADLGLETDVLDPLEGITDDSRGADYTEVMRANLEALQKALGAS